MKLPYVVPIHHRSRLLDDLSRRTTRRSRSGLVRKGATDVGPAWAPPYTPTKIEWLALTVNSQLQYDRHASDPYELYVVQADHDTLQIFIQYLPAVYPRPRAGDPRPFPTGDPGAMKNKVKAAREKIMATAKHYGWDAWVKIQEPVESPPPLKNK